MHAGSLKKFFIQMCISENWQNLFIYCLFVFIFLLLIGPSWHSRKARKIRSSWSQGLELFFCFFFLSCLLCVRIQTLKCKAIFKLVSKRRRNITGFGSSIFGLALWLAYESYASLWAKQVEIRTYQNCAIYKFQRSRQLACFCFEV